MALIQKRKKRKGKGHKWRAVIRLKGYPTVCKSFDRQQEADDWGNNTEREIKRGRFKFYLHNTQKTFVDLVERFINDGVLEHHRSSKDTLKHLEYWKEKFKFYALVHITSEMIGKERQFLIKTSIKKGSKKTKRSPATVNRYMSSLSTVLTYAKKIKWLDENPCFVLSKLKEAAGRDRILTEDYNGPLN